LSHSGAVRPVGRLVNESDMPEAIDEGVPMSFEAEDADLFRRATTYVDKILKGGRSSSGAAHEV